MQACWKRRERASWAGGGGGGSSSWSHTVQTRRERRPEVCNHSSLCERTCWLPTSGVTSRGTGPGWPQHCAAATWDCTVRADPAAGSNVATGLQAAFDTTGLRTCPHQKCACKPQFRHDWPGYKASLCSQRYLNYLAQPATCARLQTSTRFGQLPSQSV